jgi:cytochrome P450
MVQLTGILGKSPFKKLNKSYKAYVEWGQYMKEMIASKKIDLQSSPRESMDLIGQLLKSQQGNYGKSLRSAGLTDSEVMGNLFMFIIAGHETSANSIHFSLLFLALHPEAQRKVQQDLEEIFQGRSMSEWEYERDVPALLNGYLAAVLNEELRLIAPTITIPKVSSPEPQSLMVNGEDVTVPPNTMVRLCVPAVHRNPKFWPHGPPKDADKPYFPLDNLDNDLEEFKPDRWLPNKPGGPLYMPVRGSYLPFSDGQRACLGKRFAQVEILAALAVIFSEYSIELAVDEWATDDEVKSMTMEERRVTWKKAEEKGHWILQNKMVGIITLQLRGGHVPVRFVKKGEERFADI